MNYRLIDAKTIDVDKLIEYKEKSIFEYANNLSYDETNRIKNYVKETIPRQLDYYKIITVDNLKVGCLLVEKKEDGVILDEIYIDEEYRNKGIGTNIIKKVLMDNNKVFLWVYKLNNNAISLYKKLGFYIIEETESRYYMEYKN